MSQPLSLRALVKADDKNYALSRYAGVSGCANAFWRADIATICSVWLDGCLDGHFLAVDFVVCYKF